MKIEIPTRCPSCNSKLEQINSQLFCRYKECPAQSTKKMEAFTKKMRIKGFGPATIEKLGIVYLPSIYNTPEQEFIDLLGEKLGRKLFSEIERSRTVPFWRFLSALSIPLIGETAARKVAQVANSFDEMIELGTKLPLGEKAHDNFQNWFLENEVLAENLEKEFNFEKLETVSQNKGKVCITGKLNEFSNRNAAKEILENHGYTVTTTVSSQTNYLVDEEGKPSSKRKKAESLGIPIVTIANLIENN